MKYLYMILIAVLGTLLFCYGITAFVQGNFNPMEWTQAARFVMIFLWIVLSFPVAGICF